VGNRKGKTWCSMAGSESLLFNAKLAFLAISWREQVAFNVMMIIMSTRSKRLIESLNC
jgi:hypothetical protein